MPTKTVLAWMRVPLVEMSGFRAYQLLPPSSEYSTISASTESSSETVNKTVGFWPREVTVGGDARFVAWMAGLSESCET